MAENFSNDFQTTLSAAIADGVATAISVVSGTGAPAANFRIRVGNEYMLVTSTGAGTNWAVTRGIEGSTASAHVGGTVVAHVTTTGGFQQYITEQLTGGLVDASFASCLVAGSPVWTEASLTDLSQLANGPGYLTVAPVTSVAGRDGVVTLAQADIAGLTTADSPTFAGLIVNVGAVADIGQVVRGAASQTASLQEWRDDSDNVLARIQPRRSSTDATILEINPTRQIVQLDVFKVWGYLSSYFTLEQSGEPPSGSAWASPAGRFVGAINIAGTEFRPASSFDFTPTYSGGGYFAFRVQNVEGIRVWRNENRSPLVGINSTSTVGQLNIVPNWDGKVGVNLDLVSGQTAHAIQVTSNGGSAGDVFSVSATGNISIGAAYLAGKEMTAPSAPSANGYRLFAQDNGAGKTQLMAIFASGAAQQLAIEP